MSAHMSTDWESENKSVHISDLSKLVDQELDGEYIVCERYTMEMSPSL